ncbi:MAG: ATP-binding protein [Herpetosiphon sp.]
MDQVHITIPSDPVYERVVRASAQEMASTLGFDPERIEDLKLAVSEAVNNAIDHGNGRQSQLPVEITFSVTDHHLEVRVLDHGTGVEHIDWSRRVIDEEHLDSAMLRGFGLYLISSLVDQCAVESSERGTEMTLRIIRPADLNPPEGMIVDQPAVSLTRPDTTNTRITP